MLGTIKTVTLKLTAVLYCAACASQSEPIRVLVTGAAGQIAYSLLFSIAKGDVFGKEQVQKCFVSLTRHTHCAFISLGSVADSHRIVAAIIYSGLYLCKTTISESCLDAVDSMPKKFPSSWIPNLAHIILWDNGVQQTSFSTLIIFTHILSFPPANHLASSWHHSNVDSPWRRRHGAAGLRTPTSQR